MTTATLGTAATTTLTALQYVPGAFLPADFATIAAGIKRDSHNPATGFLTGIQPPLGNPFTRAGILAIPERGIVKLFPGDYVAIDATGWPIILSARAAASASWVHT